MATSKRKQLDNAMTLEVKNAFYKAPDNRVKTAIIIIAAIAIILWSFSLVSFNGISSNGVKIVQNILRSLTKPNLEWLFSFSGTSVPLLMIETVAIAWFGTIIGAILAIPFAFFASRNITGRFVSFIGSISITMVRTFPVFVLGLMFSKTVGLGQFAGVLTIGVSSIGMITKLYIEAIEDIDHGILDALDSAGCTTIQKIRYGIIPQLSANFISTAIYRFEINVRNATVLGLVGAGGIGFTLLQAMGNYRWNDASACLWGIIVVVLIIEYVSTTLRRKITKGE